MVQLRAAVTRRRLSAEIAQLPLEPLDHLGLSLNDLDQLLVLRPYTVTRVSRPTRRAQCGAWRRRPGGTR
jgi:hypothetical protein